MSMTKLNEYLSGTTSQKRCEFLAKNKSQTDIIPLPLLEDLFLLNLPESETIQLLSQANSGNKLSLENWITRNLINMTQDTAIAAFQCWLTHTDHLLWHRFLNILSEQNVPQRLRYLIVSHCNVTGGRHVLENQADLAFLDELSPAFHAILLQRATEWDVENKKLIALAENSLQHLYGDKRTERCAAESIVYLKRFQPTSLQSFVSSTNAPELWCELIKTILRSDQPESASKKAASKGEDLPIWERHKLTTDQLLQRTSKLTQGSTFQSDQWKNWTGVRTNQIENLLSAAKNTKELPGLVRCFEPWLELPPAGHVLQSLSDLMSSDILSPADLLASLSPRLRYYIGHMADHDKDPLLTEQKQTLKGRSSIADWKFDPIERISAPSKSPPTAEEDSYGRRRFFDIAYRNQSNLKPDGHQFWKLLSDAVQSPDIKKLDALAAECRKSNPLFQLIYIEALGRFKGIDAAVLKLLDFVRSKSDEELNAVIRSLSGIGTPRAIFELVSCLTRPNFSIDLRIEIAQILSHHDLNPVQDELRSALSDIQLANDNLPAPKQRELIDSLASLIAPLNPAAKESLTESTAPTSTSKTSSAPDIDLDMVLSQRIDSFAVMSSEVKRALRTAAFFHHQVTLSQAVNSIDLSPVIDMQYKALELSFRELFEDAVNRAISNGNIQRRLDVIGYARPIPAMMDQFEDYLANLPIISSIPYFSKFKMRKMLRSLCQFRPGKRFTLDGLKAFAIFFLTFSRKQCRHGLENVFPLPFKDDHELYEFVKLLHVLQDFRNRAAHEGFQPDAKNDIEGIWQSTADIFSHALKISGTLGGGKHSGANTASQRRVS